VDLEWDLLPLFSFLSLANETDVAPNKNNARMPDVKVLMPTSVCGSEKIAHYS